MNTLALLISVPLILAGLWTCLASMSKFPSGSSDSTLDGCLMEMVFRAIMLALGAGMVWLGYVVIPI